MRTIIIGLIIFNISVSSLVQAQTKCKYQIDKIDPITNKKTVTTEYKDYFKIKGANGGVRIKLVGTDLSIYLSYIFSTDVPQPFTIEKDAELIILLENKDTVKLKAIQTQIGAPGIFIKESKYISNVENDFNLSAEQFKKLKSSPASLIRFTLLYPNAKVGTVDVPVTEKYKNSIIDLINCVETKLNG